MFLVFLLREGETAQATTVKHETVIKQTKKIPLQVIIKATILCENT